MDSNQQFESPEAFAERYGTTPRHIRRLVQAGEIPAVRLGRLLRIDRPAAEARIREAAAERD